MAYKQGRTARRYGMEINCNPYNSYSWEFLEWRKGWEDADVDCKYINE